MTLKQFRWLKIFCRNLSPSKWLLYSFVCLILVVTMTIAVVSSHRKKARAQRQSLLANTNTTVASSATHLPEDIAAPEAKANWEASGILIKLFEDKDPYIQATASGKLARMGRAAVPQLAASLSDANPMTRWWTATTLGDIGPSAVDASPAFDLLESEGDVRVLVALVTAVGQIGVAKKVSFLIKLLEHPNADVRAAAACALGRIRPGTQEAISALTEALLDEEHAVQTSALEAIFKHKNRPNPSSIDHDRRQELP